MCSWTSEIAERYPQMVLYASPFSCMSVRKSHISIIGQTKGSTDFRSHQDIHCLRFEDTVFEEFESIDDSSNLTVFSEKPFVSSRDRRLCTRRLTISGCVEGVDDVRVVWEKESSVISGGS